MHRSLLYLSLQWKKRDCIESVSSKILSSISWENCGEQCQFHLMIARWNLSQLNPGYLEYKPDCTALKPCRCYRVVVILFLYCPDVKDAEYLLFKVPELVSCNSVNHVIFCWTIILPRQWKKISFQVVKKPYLIDFKTFSTLRLVK
jgi:hypothetical protein